MDFVAKKINIGLWKDNIKFLKPHGIMADPVTDSFKTDFNKLSFWECSSLEEGALEIAVCFSKLGPCDVIIFKKDELKSLDFKLERSFYKYTPIEQFRERHFDMVDLTLKDLVRLSLNFAKKISAKKGNNYCIYDKNKLLDLVLSAVKDNRISAENLKSEMKVAVKEKL
jgi:hypothetical protein